ncbi:hypothetical protein AG1IA_04110 [Rhizoctonia solani AG-1 IA]|uniref:Uncharacterized protein n=1 Tax=Thanatephorus cucumeris (strain AG1-IA) TaxID=983506 RepID=L8WZS4_THACA|nr:hypothetical protein AG1IA_04110 [Rhizoctonia solani AG-1 IA]
MHSSKDLLCAFCMLRKEIETYQSSPWLFSTESWILSLSLCSNSPPSLSRQSLAKQLPAVFFLSPLGPALFICRVSSKSQSTQTGTPPSPRLATSSTNVVPCATQTVLGSCRSQGGQTILKIHDSDIAGQYEFEMRSDFRCRQALEAARLELLHQIKKDHCNVLLVEGYVRSSWPTSIRLTCILPSFRWKLTKLRRGREMRIRVHYHGKILHLWPSNLLTHMIFSGRPARAAGNVRHRYPPFMEVLEFN